MASAAHQAPRSCYPILDNNHEQLRLLSFIDDHSSDIRLHLETFDLSDPNTCPPYTALGYAWGQANPSTDHNIFLNGEPFVVRNNLYQALLALQRCSRERVVRYLWIDALCIDQSNVLERNHQVQLMSKIYSQACQVRVWLGNEYEEGLRNLGRNVELDRSALDAFAKAPYWRRLWVLQEFELAREVVLMAGGSVMDSDSLGLKCTKLQIDSKPGATCDEDRTTSVLQGWDVTSRLIHRGLVVGIAPFSTLLAEYGHLECEDPRDSVYGLLGLVAPGQRVTIPVDYTLSARRLCNFLRDRQGIRRGILNRALVAAAEAERVEAWPDKPQNIETFYQEMSRLQRLRE
jgi:hypothetical protein